MQTPPNTILAKITNKVNYFGDKSNIHGVGHVISRLHIPSLKRFFWFTILISCTLGTFAILRAALSLYTQGSVSFSVDTNYLAFNTPFPAVTLCEQMEVDRIKTFMTAKKFPVTLTSFFKEVFFYSTKYCRACLSCKLNSTCVENFPELVVEFRVNCEEMLTDCWWDNKPFNCCERFRPLQTEYGECYAFNSRLNSNLSLLHLNRRVGLPSLVFTAIRSVSVRIHSPDDEVSAKVENILGQSGTIPLVTEFNATLRAEATTSDISIHSFDPAHRGCLLADEHPAFAQLWPFQRYSYSGCVLYCRLMMQVEFCNCTHHLMPKLRFHIEKAYSIYLYKLSLFINRILSASSFDRYILVSLLALHQFAEEIDICDLQGLACLYRNKEDLQLNLDCGCPMACEEIYYTAVHVVSTRYSQLSKELVARGSRGRVRLNTLPTMRVRRHAIREMINFVVDIGGVGGVFFGASLLSVIEIVYLLCIRRGT